MADSNAGGGRREFEGKIGYEFRDASLFERALTHSSYANEANMRAKNAVSHNENLEFLGDSVLGFVVAEELFQRNPDKKEGLLTRMRADVVCERSLAQCARSLELGGLLAFGANLKGEKGRDMSSILSDAMEAVFAAVYLDGGLPAARRVILLCLGGAIERAMSGAAQADCKTRLQELFFAKSKNVKIEYEVISETGPAHMKAFTSGVSVNGLLMGTGSGSTKKESEQNAAKAALEYHSQRRTADVSKEDRNTGL